MQALAPEFGATSRLLSTGRMETMEPPESVGGAPVTQPAEPGDPGAEAPFDEPEPPVAAGVDPEVLPDDGEGADLAGADGESHRRSSRWW